jgi:hypothetical protein
LSDAETFGGGGPGLTNVPGSASTANSPSSASGVLGALSAFKGSAVNPFSSAALGNFADAWQGGSTGQKFGATFGEVAGIAGPIAAGTMEAIKQFSAGGARGALGGTAAILGTAAALDPEPISKAILGASAMVTGIVKGLLGDPKKLRAQQISEALTGDQYLAPPQIVSHQSLSGNSESFDKYGHVVETSPFGGFSVNQPYLVKNTDGSYLAIPGSISNITPNTATPGVRAQINGGGSQAGTVINLSVHALDSQSILDRSADIAQATFNELGRGGALAQRIQATVLGS